ncbi:MAG: hypothetical protein CL610_13450 [Anaerolineaceae bacterium]|nr:hypothetical protein [Anaerolineaceae bacterium]
MLTRLQLENFKSWRDLDLKLAPLTLLFGTNSSGKTAILQSLLLLKQTANNFDRKQHINLGGGERDYVDFGSWRDLVYDHDGNSSLAMRLEWDKPGPLHMFTSEFAYVVRWKSYNDQIKIAYLHYEEQQRGEVTEDFVMPPVVVTFEGGEYKFGVVSSDWSLRDTRTALDGEELPSLTLQSCYELPSNLVFWNEKLFAEWQESSVEERQQDRTWLLGLQDRLEYNEAFEYILEKLLYLGPLRQPPARIYLWSGSMPHIIESDGENTIAALIASERQDEDLLRYVSKWLTDMGLINELTIDATDQARRFYEPKVKIGQTISSLFDVGFGVSQILPIVTMLYFAPFGSIILLEQPELHLHPNAQAVLADLMLEVAEKRRLQLIVESHSEHLLRRLQRRIAETENAFASPENIKMYFCQIEDGESKAEEVIVDEYGQIKNWPANFFGDITGDLEAMTRAALHKVMNGGESR